LLKILKNKKNNTFIVSERQYIGIIATINGFRSTLASCEVLLKFTLQRMTLIIVIVLLIRAKWELVAVAVIPIRLFSARCVIAASC